MQMSIRDLQSLGFFVQGTGTNRLGLFGLIRIDKISCQQHQKSGTDSNRDARRACHQPQDNRCHQRQTAIPPQRPPRHHDRQDQRCDTENEHAVGEVGTDNIAPCDAWRSGTCRFDAGHQFRG